MRVVLCEYFRLSCGRSGLVLGWGCYVGLERERDGGWEIRRGMKLIRCVCSGFSLSEVFRGVLVVARKGGQGSDCEDRWRGCMRNGV